MNMGKQKFDRMKKTLSILMLVFAVVPLTAVAVTAQGHGHSHGHGGGDYGGWGGFGGWGPGLGPGWGLPFDFYPPAPYGTAPGSCACGPYGCFCAPDYTYLIQATIAENGW